MIVKRRFKKWTKEEKQKIILEVQKLGVTVGCRKYDIFPSVYYDWVEKYNAGGVDGLDINKRSTTQVEKDNDRLSKENSMLKELLAERDLEIKLKDDLLKKKHAEWRSAGKS